MSENLPYMNAHSYIAKVFEKAKTATQPPRFTNDFMYSTLAVKSNSSRPIIPLMKRLGLLNSDGTPTPRYGEFRNSSLSKRAIAAGMREAYKELFTRNECAYDLDLKELTELIAQTTGLDKGSAMLKANVATFDALNAYADFSTSPIKEGDEEKIFEGNAPEEQTKVGTLGMNLSYTINLNLPETTNIAVYDAIFKSLRAHLLKE